MVKQKILFIQKLNNGEFETESIWCSKVGDNYVVDNIPFIAKRIALGDTVLAEYDEKEKAFYFDDFIEVSGNSTIRIYFDNENLIPDVREQLIRFGCESEVFLARRIVAVNVPKEINYELIKKYLEEGEVSNQWTYEESCLSHSLPAQSP